MIRQKTLRETIDAVGIGLHTGKEINLRLLPAAANTGIVFRRVDKESPVEIKAHALNVHRTVLSTEISNGKVSICTIEHLVSAFAGLGIDNAYIEVDDAEVPIMDGSASNFIFLLQSAGTVEQDAAKKYIRILKPIVYEIDDKRGEFHPFFGYRISVEIDFPHPFFKQKQLKEVVDFSTTSFVKILSRARTFGFMKDVRDLQAKDLALGGSLQNAILLDDKDIINKEGLRHPMELVLHKVLDAIGDLYLIGHHIIGEFRGYKSGHHINNRLIRKLLEDKEAFRIEEFSKSEDLPINYRTMNKEID